MTPTSSDSSQGRIVNCHTHVFTGDMVPNWLAKKYLIWPIYYFFPLTLFVHLFRWWYKGPDRLRFKSWYKAAERKNYDFQMWLKRSRILLIVKRLVELFLGLQAVYIVYDWFGERGITILERGRGYLELLMQPWPVQSFLLQVSIVLIVMLLIPWMRKIIILFLKQIRKIFQMLPKRDTLALLGRYLNIGRYAFYQDQKRIFERLRDQYPEGTAFVLLPMDMEYMAAGKLAIQHRYRSQMEQLAAIKSRYKDTALPFVFADPRRIAAGSNEINLRPGDKPYFKYSVTGGTVSLDDCFIKEFIEDKKFSGFKIYPALGYYPFDGRLLALWKYAADKGLPILTHCIKGTIFYRGDKIKDWDYHPIFEEAAGGGKYVPLLLSQKKNVDFSINFTHPLNYLCLLEEPLLRRIVANAVKTDSKLVDVFGFTNAETPLKYDLRHLKICFGHYGGEDEWKKYLEADRYGLSGQFARFPLSGLDFFNNSEGKPAPGKIEQVWRFTDWYSIISSLMLQYPNVYADISYILHDCEAVFPLLKETLQNPVLKSRVLYGTDFYVVRNHKTERNMLADMQGGLTVTEFDLIARQNPKQFL